MLNNGNFTISKKNTFRLKNENKQKKINTLKMKKEKSVINYIKYPVLCLL